MFKTKNTYKQITVNIQPVNALDNILIECLNILLKENHVYLSQTVDKKTKEV